MIYKCDICGCELKREHLRYAMQRRPSDPSDYVCVMYGCQSCFPEEPTAKELEEYFESGQAERDGLTWLMI